MAPTRAAANVGEPPLAPAGPFGPVIVTPLLEKARHIPAMRVSQGKVLLESPARDALEEDGDGDSSILELASEKAERTPNKGKGTRRKIATLSKNHVKPSESAGDPSHQMVELLAGHRSEAYNWSLPLRCAFDEAYKKVGRNRASCHDDCTLP